MANDSRSSLQNRGDDTKGRHSNSKQASASSFAASGSSSLRRSPRETSSKNGVPGTPVSQKSESHEKGVPTSPPLTRSSDRLKEQKTSSPLRRSERCKNQGGSLSSSGREPSNRSPGSSPLKGKKQDRGNNMKQLPVDRREVRKNSGDGEGSFQMKRKRHVHAYLSLFQKHDKEVEALDHRDFTTQNEYCQPDQRDSGSDDLDQVNGSLGNNRELCNSGESVKVIVEQNCAENSSILAHVPVDSTVRDENATKLDSAPEHEHFTLDKAEADDMENDAERVGIYSLEPKLPDYSNLRTLDGVTCIPDKAEVSVMADDANLSMSDGATCIPDKAEATVMADDAERAGIHSLEPKLSDDANLRTSDVAVSLGMPPVVIGERQGNLDHLDIDVPASASHVNTASVPLVSRGEAEVGASCALNEQSNRDSQSLKTSEDVGTSIEHDMSSVCKLGRKSLLEYWVPVHLSDVQLEQYCATLVEQQILLCSPARSDPVGALHDVLIANWKCCAHPYLVDPSVYGLLIKDPLLTKNDRPEKYLDFGIKASGKLELLYKMLSELKNRGLRALILFQSMGKTSLGDILEDLVRPKFGENSYERVDARATKKQTALKRFNDQECGRSFLLLESRACQSSIKLSSVDVVIIYNSDWNPANDIKCLQKITVESQFEQIKLFRLYCCCTLEEKVLICAKQGTTLDDSKLQNTNSAINHMLLMWGASYLFTKLEEFQSSCSPSSCMDLSFDSVPSLITDVLGEFLNLLPQNMENDSKSCSIIVKVEQISGLYSSSPPLFGESKIQCVAEELPHVFWANLLQGKRPRWKFMLPHRNKKRVRATDLLPKGPEPDNSEHDKKRRKLASINTVIASSKPGMEGELVPGEKGGSAGPATLSVGRTQETAGGNEVGCNVVLHGAQRSLYLFLKPEVSKLCETLDLPDDLKAMVENFLQYVIKNRHVNKEPETILQAFQLAVCWTSASLMKKKIRHRESIDLAIEHLNYRCKKEEVEQVYSMLRDLKKMFMQDMGNLGGTQSPEATDIVDLAQPGANSPHSAIACPQNSNMDTIDLAPNQDSFNKEFCSTQPGANSPHSAIACPQNSKIDPIDLAPNQDSFNKEFCTTQTLEHELELARKDTSKTCGEVETALQKQIRVEHEADKNAAYTRYKSLKEMLENQHRMEASIIRHVHWQDSSRLDKLMVLDREYAKRFEHVRNLFVAELKKLEEGFVAAMKKARRKQASLIDGDGQGVQAGLLIPEFQHVANNLDRNNVPDSVGPCTSPQTLPSEAVAALSPVERVTDPVRIDGEHCELSIGTSKGTLISGFDQCAGIGSGIDHEGVVHLNSLPVENSPDGPVSRDLDQDVSLHVCGTVASAGLEKATSATFPASEEQIARGPAMSRPDIHVSLAVAETQTVVSLDVTEPEVAIVTNIPDGAVGSDHDPPSVVCEAVPCPPFGAAVTIPALEEQTSDGAIFNERDVAVPLIAATRSMDGNAAVANPSSENAIHHRVTSDMSEVHALPDDSSPCVCSDDNQTLDPSQRILGASGDIRAGDDADDVALPDPPSSEVRINDEPISELPDNVQSTANPVCNINEQSSRLPNGQVHQAGDNPDNVALPNPLSSEVHVNNGPVSELPENVQSIGNPVCNVNQQSSRMPDGQVQQQSPEISNPQVEIAAIGRGAGAIPGEVHDNHIVHPQNADGCIVHQNSASRNAMLEQSSTTLCQEASVHVSSDQLCREGQALIRRIEDHIRPSNESCSQTAMGSTPCIPSILDTGVSSVANSTTLSLVPEPSTRPVHTLVSLPNRMPLHYYQNPLQYELDRLHREIEFTTKEHEKTKLHLKSDCEKEIEEAIAEIRRKYDKKFQEIDVDFLHKREKLESNRSKVEMNKLLADAFLDKCTDKALTARGAHETINSFAQQLLSSSSQQSAPVAPLVPGSSSAGLPPVNVRSTAAYPPGFAQPGMLNTMAPPVQTVHHASAIVSSASSGPSHAIHGIPPMVNAQFGSQLYSATTHVQPFGPASPASARAILPPVPAPSVPNQQGNTVPVTGSFTHFPSPAILQASLFASTNPVGVLLAGNNSMSAMDLLMDITNRQMASLVSNFPSQSMALPKPVNVSAANSPHAGNNPISTDPNPEIVCLSDDD